MWMTVKRKVKVKGKRRAKMGLRGTKEGGKGGERTKDGDVRKETWDCEGCRMRLMGTRDGN